MTTFVNGIVQKVEYTHGGAGNQFTTIDGVRYVTYWDIRNRDWKEGDAVSFQAVERSLWEGQPKAVHAENIHKMELLDYVKARAQAAVQAVAEVPLLFVTSYQDTTGHSVLTTHTGTACTVTRAIIDPAEDRDYDEGAMPFFNVRFADGVELVVGPEELFSHDERFFDLQSIVCGSYAVARDLGFSGPRDLMETPDSEIAREFFGGLAAFRVDENHQNFNTPDEYRIPPTQKAGMSSHAG